MTKRTKAAVSPEAFRMTADAIITAEKSIDSLPTNATTRRARQLLRKAEVAILLAALAATGAR